MMMRKAKATDIEEAPFYKKMGMHEIGHSPSGSIPGRFLPRFSLEL